jgi:PKD domain
MIAILGSCGGNSTNPTPTPTPTANRAPVIGSFGFLPQGTGLQSATIFTFSAQGVSDPDGDALTYTWSSSDGAVITANAPAASHVFNKSGVFDVRITVADSKGLSTSAMASVIVGNLTGVWDLSCVRAPFVVPSFPFFPTQFVASMTQSERSLFGTLTGGGLSHTFPTAGAGAGNLVANPKTASFGVETFDNVWAPRDADFYFHLTADDTLSSMTGSSQYCTASVARRR